MSQAQHLEYNVANRALICRDCQVGVSMSVAHRHLRKNHPGSDIDVELSAVPSYATAIQKYEELPVPPNGP